MSEKKVNKLLFLTPVEWLVLAFIIIASVMIMLPKVKQASSHRYNQEVRRMLRNMYLDLPDQNPTLASSDHGNIQFCWLDELYTDADESNPADLKKLVTAATTKLLRRDDEVAFFPVALPATYETNGFTFKKGDPNDYVLALVPINPQTITSRNDLMLLDTPVDLSQPQDAIWQKLRDAHRTTNWPDIYLCRRSGELMRLALTDLDKKLPPE